MVLVRLDVGGAAIADTEVEAEVRPLNRGRRIFNEGSLGLVSGSILTWTVEGADFPALAVDVAVFVLGIFGTGSLDKLALDGLPLGFFTTVVVIFAFGCLSFLTGSLITGGERLSDVESSDNSIFTRFTGTGFLALRLLPLAALGGGDGGRDVEATGTSESWIVSSSTYHKVVRTDETGLQKRVVHLSLPISDAQLVMSGYMLVLIHHHHAICHAVRGRNWYFGRLCHGRL